MLASTSTHDSVTPARSRNGVRGISHWFFRGTHLFTGNRADNWPLTTDHCFSSEAETSGVFNIDRRSAR